MAARIPDAEIQDALTAVVNDDDLEEEELTVRNIRNLVELRLGLGEGFLKKDKKWNEKSRKIIDAAWVGGIAPLCGLAANATQAQKDGVHDSSPEFEAEQATPSKSPVRNKKRKQQAEPPARKRAKKAAATEESEDGPASPAAERKRAKKAAVAVESDESDEDPVNAAPARRRRKVVESEDEDAVADRDTSRVEGNGQATQKSQGYDDQQEESDSELSSLIDEPPAKRKKKVSSAPKKLAKSESGSELSSLMDSPPRKNPEKSPSNQKIRQPLSKGSGKTGVG